MKDFAELVILKTCPHTQTYSEAALFLGLVSVKKRGKKIGAVILSQ